MARQFHNYTRDETRELLEASLELFAELPVPEDLRGIVFGKVVDMLSQKQLNAQDVAIELQSGIERANGQTLR